MSTALRFALPLFDGFTCPERYSRARGRHQGRENRGIRGKENRGSERENWEAGERNVNTEKEAGLDIDLLL